MSAGWKAVHVFICSTFGDMHAERDLLVKEVFPQLQEWCERRRLRLVDIDLRWGVTEAATTNRSVVQVCLNAINRCRPFFVCFLGQRYGWVPRPVGDAEAPDPSHYSQFKELTEAIADYSSVTEIEILHALQPFQSATGDRPEPSHHALFYFRDPAYLKQMQGMLALQSIYTGLAPGVVRELDVTRLYSGTHTTQTLGTLTANQRLMLGWPVDRSIPPQGTAAHQLLKLQRLRRTILESAQVCRPYAAEWRQQLATPELMLPLLCPSLSPERIDDWRARWKDLAGLSIDGPEIARGSVAEREATAFNRQFTRGRLGSFECGGRSLPEVILEDLKSAIAKRYPEHIEVQHVSVTVSETDRAEEFIDRASQGYVGRSNDYQPLNEYASGTDNRLCVVTASGGAGKSTLLANWIGRYREAAGDAGATVSCRFIGVGDAHISTIETLLASVKRELQESGRVVPWRAIDSRELRHWFRKSIQPLEGRPLVIVLDGLDQLDSGVSDLDWLPRELNPGVKVVVSFRTGTVDGDAAVERLCGDGGAVRVDVPSFEDLQDRQRLTDAYLSQYLKELDSSHLEALIRVRGASNPLYLKIVLSELKVFGSFDNLGSVIRDQFGDTPKTAFLAVLRRLESDASYTPIEPTVAVPVVFGMLAHAQGGLPEDLLARELEIAERGVESRSTYKDALDTVRFIIRQLRPFLAHRNGRVDFFYTSFAEAARDKYTTLPNSETPAWHGRLAALCARWPELSDASREYGLANLVRHHWRSHAVDAAADTLSSFRYLYSRLAAIGREEVARLAVDCHDVQDAVGASLTASDRPSTVREWTRFIRTNAHQLEILGVAGLLQAATVLPESSRIFREAQAFLDGGDLQLNWWQQRNVTSTQRDACVVTLGDETGSSPLAFHVSHLEFQPDGKRLFAFEDMTGVKVWDVDEGRLAFRIPSHGGQPHHLLSDRGQALLAVGTDNGGFALWDIVSGRRLRVFSGHNTAVVALGSTDRDHFISAAKDEVKVWNTTGECLQTLPVDATRIFALDNDRFLLGCTDNTTRLYSCDSAECQGSLPGKPLNLYRQRTRLLSTHSHGGFDVIDAKTGHTTRTPSMSMGPIAPVQMQIDATGEYVAWVSESGTEINVGRLRDGHTLALPGSESRVLELHFTGAPSMLVTAHDDGTARVWDFRSGVLRHVLRHCSDGNIAVAVHPGGTIVATAGPDQKFRTWDINAGRNIDSKAIPVEKVGRILYHAPFTLFVVPQKGSQIYTYFPAFGRLAKFGDDHDGMVAHIELSPDLTQLLSLSLDSSSPVRVLRLGLRNGRLRAAVKAGTLVARAHFLNSDQVVIETTDGRIQVWSLSATAPSRTFIGQHLAVDAERGRVMAVQHHSELRRFDLASLQDLGVVRMPFAKPGDIDAVEPQLHPDQQHILSIDPARKTVSSWNIDTGERERVYDAGNDTLTAIAVLPGGDRLVTSSASHQLTQWDYRTGEVIGRVAASEATSLVVSRDAQYLASASMTDQRVRVWDLTTNWAGAEAASKAAGIECLEVLPDGSAFFAGLADGTIQVWSGLDAACVGTMSMGGAVKRLCVVPGTSYLLAGSQSGDLALWDWRSCALVRRFEGHAGAVQSLAVLEDGRHFVTGGHDGAFRLWNTGLGDGLPWKRGKCVRLMKGHQQGIRAIAVQPGVRTALTASSDQTIRRWDLDDGRCVQVFQLKDAIPVAIALHPDGKTFVSAHMHPKLGRVADTGLQYWDSQTGASLKAFRLFDNAQSVAFSPDGRLTFVGLTLNKIASIDHISGTTTRVYLPGDVDRTASARPHIMEVDTSGEFALTGWMHLLRLWHLPTGQNVASWYDNAAIATARFLPTRQTQVVIGTDRGGIRILKLRQSGDPKPMSLEVHRGGFLPRASILIGQALTISDLEALDRKSASE